MFTDFHSQVIGFSSKKPEKRNVSDSSTETSERNSKDEITQTFTMENVLTQTESSNDRSEYDEKSLEAFLKRVSPMVLEELEIEVDFTELNEMDENEDSAMVKLNEFRSPWGSSQVSRMSWNSPGGTLAAGFAVVRHDSWCSHESKLLFYNTFSQRMQTPRVIETSSCVTAVQFHPSQPSLLVAALYNGSILVVDLSKAEEWTTMNGPTEHSASVVAIGWLGDLSTTTCYSTDANGCILKWNINLTSRRVTVLDRYQIPGSHEREKTESVEGLEVMATTTMQEDEVVVAVAGGGLFHCSLSALQPPSAHSAYKDPTVQAYQPHLSVVTSLRSGPAAKMFASASSDGQIRIYKSKQTEPRFIINVEEYPLDLFWTNCPGILGWCGLSNEINFIRAVVGGNLDLKINMTEKHNVTVTEGALLRNIVAVGNVVGNIEIWRIVLSTNKK